MSDPKLKASPESKDAASGVRDVVARPSFLVVDDDIAMTRTIARVLAPYGEVVVAHSLSQALAKVPPPGGWTAILLDVNLPDGNGFDLVADARAGGRFVPALIMSASPDTADTDHAYVVGACVLAKPFDPQLLCRFVTSPVVLAQLERVAEERRKAPPRRGVTDEARVDAILAAAIRRLSAAWRARYKLGDAEVVVLEALVSGKTHAELADEQGTTADAIQGHIAEILRKVEVATERQLVWRAMREIAIGV
jgi:DNA-binding NarL/FixJ family response regulator